MHKVLLFQPIPPLLTHIAPHEPTFPAERSAQQLAPPACTEFPCCYLRCRPFRDQTARGMQPTLEIWKKNLPGPGWNHAALCSNPKGTGTNLLPDRYNYSYHHACLQRKRPEAKRGAEGDISRGPSLPPSHIRCDPFRFGPFLSTLQTHAAAVPPDERSRPAIPKPTNALALARTHPVLFSPLVRRRR